MSEPKQSGGTPEIMYLLITHGGQGRPGPALTSTRFSAQPAARSPRLPNKLDKSISRSQHLLIRKVAANPLLPSGFWCRKWMLHRALIARGRERRSGAGSRLLASGSSHSSQPLPLVVRPHVNLHRFISINTTEAFRLATS